MKRVAIILAAMACVAAGMTDHAIIDRGFQSGRDAELEDDLYGGKSAVYQPIRRPVRIDGAMGERCETRLAAGEGQLLIDWRSVRRLELGQIGGVHRLYITGGIPSDKLIIQFPDRDAATPVFLAMERLQDACRGKER